MGQLIEPFVWRVSRLFMIAYVDDMFVQRAGNVEAEFRSLCRFLLCLFSSPNSRVKVTVS